MWRKWQIGDTVQYFYNEFDGHGSYTGTVTEIHDDHATVKANGMNLWCDDDTEYHFQHR